jgi:hypothetical protein
MMMMMMVMTRENPADGRLSWLPKEEAKRGGRSGASSTSNLLAAVVLSCISISRDAAREK